MVLWFQPNGEADYWYLVQLDKMVPVVLVIRAHEAPEHIGLGVRWPRCQEQRRDSG